jgi:PAS domain S-box-containing protein
MLRRKSDAHMSTDRVSAKGEKVNILLVDDQPENLLALEAVLAELGQNLVKAGSGRDALRHVLARDFAVILLDVQMPEMDGYETAALIRERASSRHTPLIFLTASHKAEVQTLRGYSVGAVDYLFKPLDPDILRSKVAVFVELAKKTELIKKQTSELQALNHFFTLSLDLLAIAGFDGYFKHLNPAWETTLGYSIDELLSRPWLDFVHPDDREATIAVGQRLALGDEVIFFANRYVCRDGTIRWLHWSAAQRRQDRTIYAVARDMTEVRDYQQTLSESEQRLRDITSTLGEGVFVLDDAGHLTFMNPEAERLLGWTERELLGRGLHDLIHLHDAHGAPLPAEGCKVLGTMRSGLPCRVDEDTFFCKDGTPLPVSYVTTPLVGGGQIAGCVAVFQDITARKELDRLKNEFVSTVSHELRTPLASLRGFTELMLKREFDEEKRREFIGIIHGESIRLTNLINDFLDIQRMESGRQVYVFEPIALKRLIEETIAVFGQATSSHEVVIDAPEDLPEVRADADRLRQVLSNLVSNALKFSPEGGEVRIRVRVADRALEVSVSDPGIGIPAEAMPNLFKKFFRANSPAARTIGGTGLGLAIVKEIVETHKGRIWAESEPGKGSTFVFTLPIAETAKPEPLPDVGETGADVLLVEDHPTYARLLKTHLEGEQISVAHTRYGEEVLDLARRVKPRVILLDLHLAGKADGWDVLMELKADRDLQSTPVVIITTTESRLRGLALEGADYVRKSSDPSQILDAVRRRLPQVAGKAVLIVDDDAHFRQSLAHLLEAEGASPIEEAAGGQDALSAIARRMPDLLILDFLMDDIDGFEVLRRLRRNREAVNLQVILVSGKSLTKKERKYLSRPMAEAVNQRAATLEEISETVRQMIGGEATRTATVS